MIVLCVCVCQDAEVIHKVKDWLAAQGSKIKVNRQPNLEAEGRGALRPAGATQRFKATSQGSVLTVGACFHGSSRPHHMCDTPCASSM